MKFITVIGMMACLLSLLSCSAVDENNSAAQWDFEHHIKFRQTQLNDNTYSLELLRNNDTSFEQLATFLMRQSYTLCGDYGFKIEVLEGVEGIYDRVNSPHYIFGALKAKIQCP